MKRETVKIFSYTDDELVHLFMKGGTKLGNFLFIREIIIPLRGEKLA